MALPLIMSSYVSVAESATEKATRLAARRADGPDDLRFDNTIKHAAASLTRKSNATDAVIDTVRIAIEMGGGAAYHVSGGIERLYRDVHGSLYHPLPTAQQE